MNIYDIAARCGVSIATVSRVLNNSPRVRPQTRERVLAVMQEENYTPSALARGLGGGSMHMAGILCRDIRDSFQAAAVACLEEYLRQRGMPVLLRCVGSEPQDEQQAMESLLQQGAEVLILIGAACDEQEAACVEAASAHVPIILLGAALSIKGVYGITADERGAVRELTQLLFRRQRRQILFLYDGDTYSCREKLAGYREAYENSHCPPDPQRMVAVEREPEAVNACVKQLLVKRVSFDAVIATEDAIA
ncbi:MAG: LacI family DNA-binding transcriptional regulator, partial [Clostridia bacterium]|nr:LacI family DNA-binding transcriptional regulator [Clostridia bacterium]